MVASGWIKLNRQIWENELWVEDEPFDRRAAWIDLLLMANIKDKTEVYRGNVITIKRGQVITSKVKLANRWHWSRGKVDRFLKLLEELDMISYNTSMLNTSIFIRKYSAFQDIEKQKRASNSTSHRASDRATDRASDSTLNKNNKEYKEVKKEYVCDIKDDEWDNPLDMIEREKGNVTI